MGSITNQQIIKVKTLASAFNIDEPTILRWVREQRLPPFDLSIGRHRGWSTETLHNHDPRLFALLENHLAAAREESPL